MALPPAKSGVCALALAALLALCGARSPPSPRSTFEAAPLYEAYNQLHALSQQVDVPIRSPTVIVVGRQTDGKSALIEALMGFQFNHVGGGTKTRRPIALQMQYHPEREEPICYLHMGDGEQQLSLAELQAHIEHENQQLSHAGKFATEEIVVRIEYKYCPNLSIVDTPGLLGTTSENAGTLAVPPQGIDRSRADGESELAGVTERGDEPMSTTLLQRESMPREASLASQVADVEQLVLAKIRSPEAIILCVEETNNWDVAAARSVVLRADPHLERTVVVSTKLDTKFAQFGSPAELKGFLEAAPLRRRHAQLLGGPFFTSVPAGRVGRTAGHHFHSNSGFQTALGQQEVADTQYVNAVLPGHATPGAGGLELIGVSRLRSFLEGVLRERYLAGLQSVVPQLQQADSALGEQISQVDTALADLTSWRAQRALRNAVDRFVARLEAAVQGSASSEARTLGQKLTDEQRESGARFTARDALPSRISGSDQPLFGGAQYYRVIHEWREAVRALPTPMVSVEDVTNVMGLAVGNDLMASRAASALALHRSVEQMRPLLAALFARLRYVLRRLLLYIQAGFDAPAGATPAALEAMLGERLWECLADAFEEHLASCVDSCATTCAEDLGEPGRLALLGCGPSPPAFPAGARGNDAAVGESPTKVWDVVVRESVSDWRKAVSAMVVRKVHTHLLFDFMDSLPAALATHVQAAFEGDDGIDLSRARTNFHEKRESLLREHARVSRMLLTFQRVAQVYQGAMK